MKAYLAVLTLAIASATGGLLIACQKVVFKGGSRLGWTSNKSGQLLQISS